MAMQTEKIRIQNSGEGMDEALDAAERFAASLRDRDAGQGGGPEEGCPKRDPLRLRLLTEETLGMVRSIVGRFSAAFWLEAEGGECRLHLEATADMDLRKRRELISASSEGRNMAAKGIMGKIRELIEAGLYSMDESLRLQEEYGVGILNYGTLGMMEEDMSQAMYSWSMQKYRDSVAAARGDSAAANEAWDELEKSIVANVADEVRVGIREDAVELVIIKKMPGAA